MSYSIDVLKERTKKKYGGAEMARKTTTSTEVKQRWENKAYKRYVVRLRQDTQADLIKLVEDLKSTGQGTTEIFTDALELLKNEG